MPTRRKTTRMKILDGTAAKNPQDINKNEPPQSREDPSPPPHLDKDGKAAWDRLRDVLIEAGLWSRSYECICGLYAETSQLYVQCFRDVKHRGPVLSGGRKNPALAELGRLRGDLMKIAIELGLTPTSKSKVMGDLPTSDTDLSRFFKNG